MRRYLTEYDRAYPVFLYLSKAGHPMGGSLLIKKWRDGIEAFGPFEKPQGEGLVHFTLSMPVGRTLTDQAWHEVATHVLHASGLPPDLVPWVQWGREGTACDHIHIVAGKQTFTRRSLEVSHSLAATDRLERDVCQRLSLAEPIWREDPGLILTPPVAKRKKGTAGQATWLANDLNDAMAKGMPVSLDELNLALEIRNSPWRLSLAPDQTGLLIPRNILTTRAVNPKDAGSAFSSSFILKRLALSARLQTVSLQLLIGRVIELIRKTPEFVNKMKGQQSAKTQRSPTYTLEDRQDSRRCETIAPAFAIVGRGRERSVSGGRSGIDRPIGRPRRAIERPGANNARPGQRDDNSEGSSGSFTIGYGFPIGQALSRGQWLRLVYAAARKSGVRLRHRFGPNGSALTLISEEGEFAVLDLIERHLIDDGNQGQCPWRSFLTELSRTSNCHLETPDTLTSEELPEPP